jgi:hypothetical protein
VVGRIEVEDALGALPRLDAVDAAAPVAACRTGSSVGVALASMSRENSLPRSVRTTSSYRDSTTKPNGDTCTGSTDRSRA